MTTPESLPEHRAQPQRPAWYALPSGRWRDWLTLLHLPYTAWHLAYVLIGAGLAPAVDGQRLAATLLAFGLAVGVAAHALDELRGRPLKTSISSPALVVAAAVSLAGAVALGIVGVGRVGWGLVGFVAVGAVLVVAYNLESFGGRLHNGVTFALAWGAFPLLTAYYAQTATIRPAAIAGACFAVALSQAQRSLSVEARHIRRRVAAVEGEYVNLDGSRDAVARAGLLAPLESGLRALSWSTCALGVALVLSRTSP